MIKTEKQGLVHLLKIAAPYIIVTTVYATLVLALEEYFGDHIYKISGQVVSVFGLAVAFFLGFRMNSAYDRWWEARKIFGELTNYMRSFVNKIAAYYGNTENFKGKENADLKIQAQKLIALSILFVHQLKDEIHGNLEPTFTDQAKELFNEFNINTKNKVSNEILIALTKDFEHSFSAQANIEKADLMQHINLLYTIQGKAERIKKHHF